MTKVKTYRINIEGEPNAGDAIVFGEDGVMSTSPLGSASSKNAGAAPGNVPVIGSDGMLSSSILPAAQGGMTVSIYDPEEKRADVYDMDNMEQGREKKFVTVTEKTALENLSNDLNSKVSKSSEKYILYGTTAVVPGQGDHLYGDRAATVAAEAVLPYDDEASASSIVRRTDTGAIKASAPRELNDVSTKQYVDNADGGKQDKPTSGSGAPHIVPTYIGQQYVDITNLKLYTAIGTSSEDDWMQAATGDGSVFDPTGYYSKFHAGLADQLYSTDNSDDVDTWIYRTTAGNTSITNGNAIVRRILGNAEKINGVYYFPMPTAISATGVNQYKSTQLENNKYVNGETHKITVDTGGTRSIAIVPVVGGVTNGYMIKTPGETYGFSVNFSSEYPTADTVLEYLGICYSGTNYKIAIPNTGYIVITGLTSYFTSDFQVHPAWSGQQDNCTDAYEEHVLELPTQGKLNGTGSLVTLPYVSQGLMRIGDVYDEINFVLQKYIKRIDKEPWTQAAKEAAIASGRAWMEDENYVYCEMATPAEYSIEADREYLANDYGTEEIIFLPSAEKLIAPVVELTYGVNLTDKLRSDVLVKGQQTLTVQQQAQVLANLGWHVVDSLPEIPVLGDLYILID